MCLTQLQWLGNLAFTNSLTSFGWKPYSWFSLHFILMKFMHRIQNITEAGMTTRKQDYTQLCGWWPFMCIIVGCLRPPLGVCWANLHQAYIPCVIGVMPLQTHGNVRWWSTYIWIRVQLSLISTIHSHGFVMALFQWYKVDKLSEDKLHRPPWWP